ncbi:MAG TPA: 3-isopropylmalate dehydrogenase [Pyrinomonadaceae bacterium]|nr:3-isopropylmalate dehydrogenase [Pyrinomonadaceae bacterium]
MKRNITTLPGDGIGPEVITEAVRVLQTIAGIHGYRFEFEEQLIGGVAIRRFGSPLPTTTLDACLMSDAVLLGAVGSPEYDRTPPNQRPEAGLLLLRSALGGYANLRPAISYPSIAACSPVRREVASGTDILIVRELLGGLYFGEPRGIESNVASNTMRYSVEEIERIAKVAFEEARKRRGKVTSVDKANVLETSQLWRQTVIRMSQNYPDVTLEHLYVDACAMHLIANPRRFDVLLTENLFGDILSDEAAVITGSLGMLASATIGGEVGLYEPVHGSAPDIAGRGAANPCGAIASAAMMLRHSFNLEQDACDIELAIEHALEAGYRTPDIAEGTGGYVVTTSEFGEVVCEAVTEIVNMRHAYHAV